MSKTDLIVAALWVCAGLYGVFPSCQPIREWLPQAQATRAIVEDIRTKRVEASEQLLQALRGENER